MSYFDKKIQILSAITLCFALFGGSTASAVWDGTEVKSDQWRGVVQTYYGDDHSACSATIVHPHLMITAAHCYSGTSFPQTMKVIFNHKKMSATVTIAQMQKHRKYSDIYVKDLPKETSEPEREARFRIGHFDIMWIKTVEDLTSLGGEVYEVAQSQEEIERDLSSKAAYAVGFGGSRHDKRNNRGWSRTGVPNQSSKRFNQLFPVKFIYADKYGHYQVHGAGVCSGDSGSGLYVDQAGTKKILGVLSAVRTAEMTEAEKKAFKEELKKLDKSFNPAGCDRNRLGIAVYVPISAHICWVQQNSGINLNAKCN